MHLRISDEAEMLGLDLDQLFEEQIGDWSYFEGKENKVLGASMSLSDGEVIQGVAVNGHAVEHLTENMQAKKE